MNYRESIFHQSTICIIVQWQTHEYDFRNNLLQFCHDFLLRIGHNDIAIFWKERLHDSLQNETKSVVVHNESFHRVQRGNLP